MSSLLESWRSTGAYDPCTSKVYLEYLSKNKAQWNMLA